MQRQQGFCDVGGNVKNIVIVGGTGFIGRALIEKLMARQDVRLDVLVRRGSDWRDDANVSYIEGDLLRAETLSRLVTPGCVVINLAYLRRQPYEVNREALLNLLDVCERNGVGRLIHSSTAAVVGKCKDIIVDESTVCNPSNDYERTKLSLEELIFERSNGKYECVIVRPTAVFGPGGLNALKLVRNLWNGTIISNYIRSCLFNSRGMNLVCVENVVAALEYFIGASISVDRNVYLISDDDEIGNNYGSVEARLMELMGIEKYPVSVIPVPRYILQLLLEASGRGNASANRIYSCKKLLESGFKKQITLDGGLTKFAEWYVRTRHAAGVNR